MAAKLNVALYKWFVDWQSLVWSNLQMFLIIVMLGALAVAVFRYHNTVSPVIEPKNLAQSQAVSSDGVLTKETKPLSFYTDIVGQRDIFHFKSNVANNTAVVYAATSPTGINFTSRYVIKGIVFDKDSQVIIKDVQNAKVYFVRRNETLDGATLVSIGDNKAVFNLAGETLELIKK